MEKLLMRLAHSFSATTGLQYEDLFQEAYLAYLEAMKTYNPDRGAITTHIWWCVSNHLKNYIKKQPQVETIPFEEYEQSVSSIPFWERLSKDALSIAELVINYPLPFLELGKTHAPKKIKQIMEHEGWDKKRISLAIFELQKNFSS